MKLVSSFLKLQSFVQRYAPTVVLSVVLLFFRAAWGYGFFLAGSGKLSDISKPIAFFTKLGIPAPAVNAYFVGTLECVGGLLLLVGLFSRPIAFLLTGNMIVAYLTAHRDTLQALFGPDTDQGPFFNAPPFWFIVTSLLVLAFGPGRISIDAFLSWLLHRIARKQNLLDPSAAFPADGGKGTLATA
jgi:putative oxidoreductase